MSEDDYSYMVYRVLVYLYGCFKRRYPFDRTVFEKKIMGKGDISEDYLNDVLRYIQKDGLIEGLAFQKAWGREYILASGYDDMAITSKGMEYLEENRRMRKITEMMLSGTGMIAELARIVLGS